MDFKQHVRVVPGFPKEGISFKDITTLLKQPAAYKQLILQMADTVRKQNVQMIIGPEARGFVIGAPLAYELGVGFVLARKPGKLPAEAISQSYGLEYGQDSLWAHKDAITRGMRVVVVDDLLATGGTALACCKLVEELGGEVVAVLFAMELTYLGGRDMLEGYNVWSAMTFDD